MCKERWRTRDLLLEYDLSILPPRPRAAGLNIVYPWENVSLNILEKEIYQLALKHGFAGDEDNFWNRFSNGSVITGTVDTFPVPGDEACLYLDTETDILYYFKSTQETIYPESAARIGAVIVGEAIIEDTQQVVHYLYIPIRALLIEDTILNCGDAAEYID